MPLAGAAPPKSRHHGLQARSPAARAVNAPATPVAYVSRRFALLAGVGASAALLAARRGVPGGFGEGGTHDSGSSACVASALVEDAPSLRDQMGIVMDTTACMSTLYGHASQYLREVNAGFRSPDMLPDNVMRTITNIMSLNSMPRFMDAVNAIAASARPPSKQHAQTLSTAVLALETQSGVLRRCCSDIAAHRTDMTMSCQQLVTALRELLAQVEVLQAATAMERLPNGGRCTLSA